MTTVKKYTLGNPINTHALDEKFLKVATLKETFKISEERPEEMELFSWNSNEKSLCCNLTEDERVYGLGETVRGINKRGWIYESWCSDEPHHLEDKRSLYGALNFLVLDNKERKLGIFVDCPSRVTFDVGYSNASELRISFEYADAELYVISGNHILEIVKTFRKMIGKSYIPPKWAFGLCQSRWSYFTAEEVRQVADRYDSAGIPLDAICLDIDYMQRYKDFTVDHEKFPEFPEFVSELKDRGIHPVPIIDAGVKIEEGYDVYEEGVEKNYFCKNEDDSDFVAAVWPGRVHFPDVLNENAREWFGNFYGRLTEAGVDGFWNDMNEPAIFYTEEHLKGVFEKIEDYKGKNLDIQSFFEFKDLVGSVDNRPGNYDCFYHHMDGEKIRHDRVHNLYGYNMTRAAGEAFLSLRPGQRTLMYSRASYVGMHRYGGIWTGDNFSWWSHILLNLQEMPGLNMCGFLYTGADTGGFGCDCTEDLMFRWLGVSLFTPLFRNHSAMGTRRQEFYQFEHTEEFKNLIRLRYALIPYLYSEFMKAVREDEMYMCPLAFAYEEDERAKDVEDQLLVGESIMIAPVYTQNARGRYVHLPEPMKLIRFRAFDDFDEEDLSRGDHYISAHLNEVLVFLRPGHVLPLAKPANRVPEIDYGSITYICNGANPEEYELYNDDGVSAV